MEITIDELKQLSSASTMDALDNGMLGEYVIVRCRDAGVHCGILEAHNGRSCVLIDSRRLWYYKPADGTAWLNGLASAGADPESKISRPVARIHLTENCEIILCSNKARASLIGAPNYNE